MAGFLALLNQLICNLNASMHYTVEEVFPAIASRICKRIVSTVPGFRRFIIDGSAMNCCFDSVLDKSFKFHDANTSRTLILCGEIVLAQKVMYEKFGDDFLAHFVTKCFTSAHCPQDLASQYCQNSVLGCGTSFDPGYSILIRADVWFCYALWTRSKPMILELKASKLNVAIRRKLMRVPGNDTKAPRSFYQSHLENLRLQQNGNPVFRWS
uniref:Exportin-T n=1 Tax=Salix viminalis TaxID=40686 RepID=A0A6N2KWZ0_SALVM